MLMRHYEFF